MTKEELLSLLRVCGADPSAIDAVELAFEAGRQQGIKQERALWELAKIGQEIERTPDAWGVTWDGELMGNIFEREFMADTYRHNLNEKNGPAERVVVALFMEKKNADGNS